MANNNNKRPSAEPAGLSPAESKINAQNGTKRFSLKDSNTVNDIILATFILLCYVLLVIKNASMLQWYDEMSLFDSTPFFFNRSLHYPGGLLSYVGSWLTQLMYYPWLGSTVLIAMWLLTWWLTVKTFRLSAGVSPLGLLVPMCMLVSVVQLDEAWVSMNSAGYLFANTLGYLFVIVSIWVYRLCEKRQALATVVILLTAACYFLFGFFALLGAVLGAILLIGQSIRQKKYIGLLLAALVIAFIIVLPNLYYSYFSGTTVDNDYLHLKGLPDLLMEEFDAYLWRPFIIASVCLIGISLLGAFTKWLQKGAMMRYTAIAAVSVMAIWSLVAEKKNEQLRASVEMLRQLEDRDWYGITETMSKTTVPANMTMRILNNVAVISLGGKGVRLDGMLPVDIDPRHSETFTMTAFVNIPVNYYEGLFNESYRWAMEHSVQYGKRVFYLKYMVKNALLNGETELARRYNDILLGTMFHRRWAREMQRYIDDPRMIETNPEFKGILELSLRHNQQKPHA